MNLDYFIAEAFRQTDPELASIPNMELYMDQILTILEETLQEHKRYPSDKIMTKTMVNNYSKEGILSPVKGKKYSRQQVIHLLCIYLLKQTLSIKDVKILSTGEDINYAAAYDSYRVIRRQMEHTLPRYLSEQLPSTPESREDILAVCLALSAAATSMTKICQEIADHLAAPFDAY